MSSVFDAILAARGLSGDAVDDFLVPDYGSMHDPFLLPDMEAAVARLQVARNTQEHITIYGDYDIDGLTATTVLVDALGQFGFEHVDVFIPNRFVEGYGLTVEAVEKIAASGANLIITVDCGSLSEKEIIRASELGVDVIVTDHHNVAPVQPPAVAVINPKRLLQEFPEAYEGLRLKGDNGGGKPDSDAAGSSQSTPADTSLSSAELAKAQTSSTRQEVSSDVSGLTRASSSASLLLRDDSRASGGGDAASNSLRSKPEGQAPPKNLYPFLDLAGVGVAFKLVQALQTRLDGMTPGQEKWLLDLVALGTVCDVVRLVDENRTLVYYGLKVMAKSRRLGLKALMAVAGVDPDRVNARNLGFGLGPRMNAAGRLETAQFALDMLLSTDGTQALEHAQKLDDMNRARRREQDQILEEAIVQAEARADDAVLVVSSEGWNHGIIGIVAAKLLEKYKKPTYVLEEMGDNAKGSARSYGDFSAADAIRASDDIITKGGGHKFAAGVTLPTDRIGDFRRRVNEFYQAQHLKNQADLLLPRADVDAAFPDITEALIDQIATLEPFGSGNPQPIIRTADVLVTALRRMGSDGQHVKLTLQDDSGASLQLLAFSAPEHFFVEPGERLTVWYQPDINEWQGRRTVEGRLLHLETIFLD